MDWDTLNGSTLMGIWTALAVPAVILGLCGLLREIFGRRD